MKKKWIITLGIFLLVACASEEKVDSSKKGSRKGRSQARMISVEGYLAEPGQTISSSKLAGNLSAYDEVELKTEMAGKLVALKVKDGAYVKKGSLIAKINDAELQAQLKQANASLELAKQKEIRTKTLFEKQSATQAELETVVAARASAEASVALILAQIRKTEVIAPFSGTLGILKVSAGEWVTTGTSIATLANVQKLKVSFSLPQRYATSVSKGTKVKINDSERGISAEATVRVLEPILSQNNRSRIIQAEINNKDNLFIAGSFVEVTVPIEAGSEKEVIHVPAEAFTLDDKGPYLFVAEAGKAVKRYVTTGLRTPISISVLDGLNKGDTIIVSGMMSVREGISIQIKEWRRKLNYGVEK